MLPSCNIGICAEDVVGIKAMFVAQTNIVYTSSLLSMQDDDTGRHMRTVFAQLQVCVYSVRSGCSSYTMPYTIVNNPNKHNKQSTL